MLNVTMKYLQKDLQIFMLYKTFNFCDSSFINVPKCRFINALRAIIIINNCGVTMIYCIWVILFNCSSKNIDIGNKE